MPPVAALDCGTNSLRLLVAEPGEGGLTELARRTEIVRLGQGVDRTGLLDAGALERTRAVLAEYAGEIARHGADRVRLVATSALRDARNRDEFVAMVQEVLGVEPDIVSGLEEAQLTFRGAAGVLASATHAPTFVPPVLVVDIGGGSTEFVLGTTHADHLHSVDIGCVRLTERHLTAQQDAPLTDAHAAGVIADVTAALDVVEQHVPIREARSVVCVAGTATTVAALAMGLEAYSRDDIHHAHISVDDVCAVTDRLLGSTVAQITAMPSVHPGRADVLTAGALVLRTVLERVSGGTSTETWNVSGYTASEHDILDGIAWSVIT